MTEQPTSAQSLFSSPAQGVFNTVPRTSSASEVEEIYRDAFKARFMDDYNLLRRESMLREFRRRLNYSPNTEMRHVAAYALAFPDCRHIPLDVAFDFDRGMWTVELDYYDQEPTQAALAYIAMQDITSLPVIIEAYGDGKGGVSCSDADIESCRAEIATLKRFNLWHPERCLAVILGERPLTRF